MADADADAVAAAIAADKPQDPPSTAAGAGGDEKPEGVASAGADENPEGGAPEGTGASQPLDPNSAAPPGLPSAAPDAAGQPSGELNPSMTDANMPNASMPNASVPNASTPNMPAGAELMEVPNVQLQRMGHPGGPPLPPQLAGMKGSIYDATPAEKVHAGRGQRACMFVLTPRFVMLCEKSKVMRVFNVVDVEAIFVKEIKGGGSEVLFRMLPESGASSTMVRFKNVPIAQLQRVQLARLQRLWQYMKGNDVPFACYKVPPESDYKKGAGFGGFHKQNVKDVCTGIRTQPKVEPKQMTQMREAQEAERQRQEAARCAAEEAARAERQRQQEAAAEAALLQAQADEEDRLRREEDLKQQELARQQQVDENAYMFFPHAGDAYEYEPPPAAVEPRTVNIAVPPAEPKVIIPADMLALLRSSAPQPPVVHRRRKNREAAGEPVYRDAAPKAKPVHLHLHLGNSSRRGSGGGHAYRPPAAAHQPSPQRGMYATHAPQQSPTIDNDLPVMSPIGAAPYAHARAADPAPPQQPQVYAYPSNASSAMGAMRHLRL